MRLYILLFLHFVFQINGISQSQFYINAAMKVSPGTVLYSAGSDLIVDANANIINQGDWTVVNPNISLSAGSNISGIGSLKFKGITNQFIDGNGNSIDCNIELDNTNHLRFKNLNTGQPLTNTNLLFGGNFTFQQGHVITDSNKIIFKSGSSYSGASDNSHINGWCQKAGSTAFTFPVGNGAKLRTASISAPFVSTDNFLCKYFKSNPDTLYNVGQRDTALKMVSKNEYWRIERVAGTSAVDVTLSWYDSFSGIIGNLSNMRVARWDGGAWRDHGNGGTTGTFAAGTVKSGAPVSSFSPFTLATSSLINILPVELLSFTAVKKDRTSYLQWSTASEKNSDYFIVERSLDGYDWKEIGNRKAAGNSNTIQHYALTDFDPAMGINYYRLKQLDFDLKFAYSPIRTVVFSPEFALNMYPNPTTDFVTITTDLVDQSFDIFDVLGQVVIRGKLNPNKTQIDLGQLAAGSYIIKLYPSNQNLIIEKQ